MIATDWNSLQIWWHAQLIPDTDQSSLNWGHGITEAIFSLRVWLWWKWIPLVEVYLSRKKVSFWPQATGWGHTQPLTEATQWLRPLLLTTSTKRPPIPKNMWKGPETEIFSFFLSIIVRAIYVAIALVKLLLQRFLTHILDSVKLSHPYFVGSWPSPYYNYIDSLK